MTGINCSIAGATYAAAGRTALTITAYGNAQVDTALSKFGGASLLVDGTGDYLTISDWPSTAGDFTIEFWVYQDVWQNGIYFDSRASGATTGRPVFYYDNGRFRFYDQGTGDIIYSDSNPATNQWVHIAVSRSGSSTKMFFNGTQNGATNTTWTTALAGNSLAYLGSSSGGASAISASIDEFRFSNTARYTGNFTAPTAAFTNDANTLFLLHCNGTDASTVFTDDIGTNALPRTPKTITAGGNAKVSTAQSKFGGASALFDGTSDYLSVPGLTDLAFGTGNFTLEAWVRQSARSDAMVIFDTRNSGNTSGGFILYMRADNYMELYWNSASVSSANPLPTVNTWYHVAISRSGSALKVFVDGTSVISITDSQDHSASGPFIVGQDFQLTATPGNSWNGYMDEVRFSNTARYTANFIAPTATFTNDRDTVLLLHCDGTNNSTTFTDDNA